MIGRNSGKILRKDGWVMELLPGIYGGTNNYYVGDYQYIVFDASGYLFNNTSDASVSILLVGGGGGSGGCSHNGQYDSYKSGGGGGGEVVEQDITLPIGTYWVQIGNGGAPGGVDSGNGGDGGTTKLGTLIAASGGKGSLRAPQAAPNWHTDGGNSGSGYVGGDGIADMGNEYGAGGGGAGATSNGGNGSINGVGGAGGQGYYSTIMDVSYGGGGGGASFSGGLAQAGGGVGWSGYVVGQDGSANTGGGAGGVYQVLNNHAGLRGGTGKLVIKYKYQ